MMMYPLNSVDRVGDDLGNQTINASSHDGLHQEKTYQYLVIFAEYYPVAYEFEHIFPLILYPIGYVGNLLSAVVWFHCRLRKRNISATYLALLAVNDLLLLILHCIGNLDRLLSLRLAKHPLFCELFHCMFFFFQYLSPFIVLGFTAERFVAVCYPFHWRILCRTRVELKTISIMIFGSLILASFHPLFWTSIKGSCGIRETIPGLESFWLIWTLITEIAVFFVVPLLVLILDVLVIRTLCQMHSNSVRNPVAVQLDHKTGQRRIFERPKAEAGKESDESSSEGGNGEETATGSCKGIRFHATTIMILVVSVFEIMTTLPCSVLYLLQEMFPKGDTSFPKDEILNDPTWLRYYKYAAVQCILIPICLSRYAILVFFYSAMGPRFRATLRDIACRRARKTAEVTRITFSETFGGGVCQKKENEMCVLAE